eukprot:jgi/Orpsp1_1/1177173/evm.model.c7180000060460.1
MKFSNLLPILSVFSTFVVNTTYAFDFKSSLENKLPRRVIDDSNTAGNENYFMIFVNNGSSKDGKNNKREEAEQRVNSVIDEITTLIVDNIDTYENPAKLEEFEQSSNLLLRKRDNENNESALAYSISSLDDKTIIYSYLSDVVAGKVEKIPNVMACVKDREIHFTSENGKKMNQMEKLNEILSETQWSGVDVREDADIHLSLLSQGKFDGNSTTTYDKNYYYPSSAGKDIDIFILDSGFNFRHPEFANKDERTVKCAFTPHNAIILPSKVDDYCEFTDGKIYHGLMVSDVAGGLVHGVANKANIYGIPIFGGYDTEDEYPTEYPSDQPLPTDGNDYPTDYYDDDYDDYTEYPSEDPTDFINEIRKEISEDNVFFISSVIASLKYIDENMLRPNKAVFNFSFGLYLDGLIEEDKYIIDYWRDYIDHMSSRGAVFVVSAGNEKEENTLNGEKSLYPCAYDNVICVGATDNAGMNVLDPIENEIEELYDKLFDILFSGEEKVTEEAKKQVEEIKKRLEEIIEIYDEEYDKIANIYSKKVMNPEHYRVASFSNFGKKVEIYAPGWAEVEYRDIYGRFLKELTAGTSFSSPIVAGIAATIMSEHPEIKFDTKKMKEYLIETGEKNIIEGIAEGNPNVFVSNGKHSVYPGSDNEEIKFNDEKVSDFIDEVETDDFIDGEIDDE